MRAMRRITMAILARLHAVSRELRCTSPRSPPGHLLCVPCPLGPSTTCMASCSTLLLPTVTTPPARCAAPQPHTRYASRPGTLSRKWKTSRVGSPGDRTSSSQGGVWPCDTCPEEPPSELVPVRRPHADDEVVANLGRYPSGRLSAAYLQDADRVREVRSGHGWLPARPSLSLHAHPHHIPLRLPRCCRR